jgi:D-methionine transport system permease protein
MNSIDWNRMGPILWQSAGETLYMVGLAVLWGGLFGLIIGLGLYLTRRGNLLANKYVFAALNVIINIVRPTPFIIFAMALGPVTRAIFGRIIGIQAFTFAMAVTAAFAFSRLVEQNLLSVDPGVVEAARAMGASPWRIIRTVLIPEALGPLILALTFLLVAVTDMSAIGNMLGAGGLGSVALTEGYRQFNWTIVYLVVAILVIGVQIFQALGNYLARRVMRR